jgi:hypothetical protein
VTYQSEAQLEQLLIENIAKKGYEVVDVKDNDSLLANFRDTVQRFNKPVIGR